MSLIPGPRWRLSRGFGALVMIGLLLVGCRDSTPPPVTVSPVAVPSETAAPTATVEVEDPNPLRPDRSSPTATSTPEAPGQGGGQLATPSAKQTASPQADSGPPRRIRPPTPTIGPAPPRDRGFQDADRLADPAWLERNLDDSGLRIVDARSPEAFAAGHLPGAVNLGPQWLVDLSGKVPAPLLAPDGFAAEMEASGISQDHEVIVYDDDGGLWAARVLWALEVYGQKKVRLLEGGLRGWQAAGKPVSVTQLKPEATKYEPRPVATVQIAAPAVAAALKDPGVVIVDVRSEEEYRGKLRLAARAGRIPGAVNLYWRESLRSDGQYFKTAAELEAIFRPAGVTPDKTVIVYCQNGVRAAHVYFTLKLLGYPDVRLYDGSWLDWGNRTDLPIETENS